MKNFTKNLVWLLLSLFCLPATAQHAEMADGMRAEGKIYVVVAIIVTILVGLFAYLFSLDRKITRLEKRFRG